MSRNAPIPVSKMRQAQSSADKLAFEPETLDQCTAQAPDAEDGLTRDEKMIAISRLETSGRTRSSEGAKEHPVMFEDKLQVNLRFGWVCQAGFYPEDLSKANQDNLVVAPVLTTKSPQLSLFGVFDGHGRFGTECSTFAAEKFPRYVAGHKALKEDPAAALEEALVRINKEMHKAKKKRKSSAEYFDDSLAGTTAITVLINKTSLIVANVGDSRAIVGMMTPSGLKADPLSADQTPYRRDERVRCKKAGAVVMTMDQLEGYKAYNRDDDDWGDEEDDGGDPPRLWLPNKGMPGVAFTRSLGDEMAESIGCIPNPEILRRRLTTNDNFIVIASDGVFEFLSSQTVVDMVSMFTDPHEAARALVAESYKLWLHYEVRTDDITAIVIFLEDGVVKSGDARRSTLIQSTVHNSSFKSHDELVELGDQNRPVRREMSRQKRQVIEAIRVEDEDDEDDQESSSRQPKTTEELSKIKSAISTNFLFQHLNPMQLEEVMDAFELVHVKKGETVIKQGEEGNLFYVVATGEYDTLITPEEGGEPQKVHSYAARENSVGNPSFGELALMYSKPRAATVVATTDGTLWSLKRKTFRRVLIKRPHAELINSLRKIKVLESLGKSQMQRLADVVSEVTFKDNEILIRQGDAGDTMYIIKDGCVKVTIDEEVQAMHFKMKREGTFGDTFQNQLPDFDPTQGKEVMRISAGGYVGERALLQDEPRAASAIAVGPTTCFYISRKAFEDVLGPLTQIISRNSEFRQAEAMSKLQAEERRKAFGLGPEVSIMDFNASSTITETELFTLKLASSAADPGKLFTMKSYNRNTVEAAKLQERVQHDRDILPLAAVKDPETSTCSINCVFPIMKTWTGAEGLHMGFQGVCCATLHDFMSTPLDEKVARFLIANVTLIVENLHSKHILIRSVSPSLGVDAEGYIRLHDMGNSKVMDDDFARTFTLCGDESYVSPEQVLNSGHSYSSDFWALGILLYELVQGRLPFSGKESPFPEIAQFDPKALEFKVECSDACKDLIKQLCTVDVRRRLASVESIMEHPFMKGFPWSALSDGSAPSPLRAECQAALKEVSESATSAHFDKGVFPVAIPEDAWFAEF